MSEVIIRRLNAHVAALEQLLEVQERIASDANEQLLEQAAALHAVNAELASQQEELQAANEELSAQQEELQTAHDELGTVYGRLKDHNDLVETEVERRTTELRQANELLVQAERHKDEFLTVISHELRTPLNFIMGFASTLDDEVQGPLNPAQHSALQKILNGTDRMLLLVEDLLDFARLQTGKFSLDRQQTNFGALVDEVVGTLQPLAEQRGIRLLGHVPVFPAVWIDEARIVQVLTNLVGNALKFTPAGGMVTVRASLRDEQLVTEVSDTGCGIHREDLPRIFEKFKQLDMSTTRAVGGVGLGLSIELGPVSAHGGTIEAESEPGQGATFRFSLPVGTPAHAPAPHSSPREALRTSDGAFTPPRLPG